VEMLCLSDVSNKGITKVGGMGKRKKPWMTDNKTSEAFLLKY
jgi:hypothetical protein